MHANFVPKCAYSLDTAHSLDFRQTVNLYCGITMQGFHTHSYHRSGENQTLTQIVGRQMHGNVRENKLMFIIVAPLSLKLHRKKRFTQIQNKLK